MSRDYLVQIVEENESWFPEILERFPELENHIAQTHRYKGLTDVGKQEETDTKTDRKDISTVVEVVDMDTIQCSFSLVEEGLYPLVLNLASSSTPGGGWKSGATAQEEELFRRSTYPLALCPRRAWYPLKDSACIVSPNVLVFRGPRSEDYYPYEWKECKYLDFIAMPALRSPKVKSGRLSVKDVAITREKIRTIFEIGKVEGYDSLVLGAMGCGAYGNPPEHVAEIFRDVIAEYPNIFQRITFAILTDHNDRYGNFATFQKVMTAKDEKPEEPRVIPGLGLPAGANLSPNAALVKAKGRRRGANRYANLDARGIVTVSQTIQSGDVVVGHVTKVTDEKEPKKTKGRRGLRQLAPKSTVTEVANITTEINTLNLADFPALGN